MDFGYIQEISCLARAVLALGHVLYMQQWIRSSLDNTCTLHTPRPCPLVHDDVIKWKHIPRNWPSVRGIHRSPVNSPRKGQWRGALMFSLICVWINDWVNNRGAGDLRRYRTHCDVNVMCNSLAPWGRGNNFTTINLEHIMQDNSPGTRCEIALRWMPQNGTKKKSTLVQVMA